MHSISKTVVTLATAQQLIADLFGDHVQLQRFHELTDGWFNAAYTLELSDGRRFVLKVAPPAEVEVLRYERDMMAAEVAVMRLVQQQTSVPLPEIIHYDTSRTLMPSPFFLMTWVPGTSLKQLRPTLTPEEQAAIDGTVGGYLRQINAIRGDSFGYVTPSAARFSRWPQAFAYMFECVLQDGEAKSIVLPRPYAAFRDLLQSLLPALDEVRTPQLVHWDLWDANIFIDPATKRVTGLIDFERAVWGDPLMEAQFMLDQSPAFFEQYGPSPLDGPHARLRRLLYNIYLFLIMKIECTYRQYDDQELEELAYAQLTRQVESLEAALQGAS
jgi:aminoglycoside phosphotransferase (APT) family kinase protein